MNEPHVIASLSPDLADRLGGAFQMVGDLLMESMEQMFYDPDEEKWHLEATWIYDKLPQKYQARLTPYMITQFYQALCMLSLRVLGPSQSRCACRAEELLLYWSVEQIKIFNDNQGSGFEDDEADEFQEDFQEDFDFELMYDPMFDGVEYNEQMGTGSFSLEHWFLPFNDERITCPLSWPEKIGFYHPNWRDYKYPKNPLDEE